MSSQGGDDTIPCPSWAPKIGEEFFLASQRRMETEDTGETVQRGYCLWARWVSTWVGRAAHERSTDQPEPGPGYSVFQEWRDPGCKGNSMRFVDGKSHPDLGQRMREGKGRRSRDEAVPVQRW